MSSLSSSTSTSADLKSSIYRSLEDRGALNEIRARIRAEIFKSFNQEEETLKSQSSQS